MTALPSTLTQLQRKIAGKALSAQEAWQLQLGRRDALNARWHCLSQPLGSEGQADSRGPLAGIALAHKDNLDTWNRRSGCGVDRGESQQGLAPAWAIGALQRAGAGLLGTTVMPELACGATSTNPRFEPCVNPLDPRAVVGGSSSGSAVAVAGGMAYGSLAPKAGHSGGRARPRRIRPLMQGLVMAPPSGSTATTPPSRASHARASSRR